MEPRVAAFSSANGLVRMLVTLEERGQLRIWLQERPGAGPEKLVYDTTRLPDTEFLTKVQQDVRTFAEQLGFNLM